jgi:hypothetical protein
MGLFHPRFMRADVGMDGPETVDAQTWRELQAMMWHSIIDSQQHCYIMPDSLPEHPKQSGALCNEEAACIVCAACKYLSKSDSEAYKFAKKTEIYIGRICEESLCKNRD